MHLESKDLGKKYTGRWIFRHLNLNLHPGNRFAITGSNGSGKSTLAQILSGMMYSSEGTISYRQGTNPIEEQNIRKHISFSAPYLLLPEQFTGREIAKHWFSLKTIRKGRSWEEIFESAALQKGIDQAVKTYSSGMKSRLKLGLALLSDVPLIVLDEPTANMDGEGMDWYQRQLSFIRKEDILIIASNSTEEYKICDQQLDLDSFKTKEP